MSEAEKVVESGTSGGQSAEEKFFGVRTTIGQRSQSKSAEKPEFDIEVVDDRPPEDRPFPRANQSSTNDVDIDVDDKELEGYSKKVQKRIDKLRYAQHEERRKKEEAEDPVLQMQRQELEIKQQQAQAKAQAEMAKINLDMQKAISKDQLERDRLDLQERTDRAKLGAKIAAENSKEELESRKIAAKSEIEGAKIGVGIAKDLMGE